MDCKMLVTLAGEAAIRNAAATEKKVDCAKIVYGDAGGTPYEPNQSMTELKNKLGEVDVTSVTLDSNAVNQFTVSGLIPSDVGGFDINELGIVDSNDILLGISSFKYGHKISREDGGVEDIYLKLKIAFDKPEVVVIKVDPFVAQATQDDLHRLEQALEEKLNNLTLYECDHSDLEDIVGNESLFMDPDDLEYMTDADVDALFPNLSRED